MYLGIDIGSSSSKAAVLDEDKNILAVHCVNKGTGTSGIEEALAAVFEEAGCSREDIKYSVVTGYGRLMYKAADKQITEITCHAKGARFLFPEVTTVIDIGGQDAKVIKLSSDGNVADFVMNEKCAAGTGRFLEVMARVLGCDLGDLSFLASKSQKEVPISSVCTVFAESEVISRLASGERTADVARGAHRAIAKRIVGMCNRVNYDSVDTSAGDDGESGPVVAMSGGVALNDDMVKTMGQELGTKVTAAPYPQGVGAVGAAVIAWERSHR